MVSKLDMGNNFLMRFLRGSAKTCRSTRTAFASELEAEGPLGAQVSYY